MALPVVVSVSLLTTGISPQTVALPPVKAVDDILLMQVGSSLPAVPVTIADAAGGTWSPIGGFGGSQANEGVRGTWFWSRYNETQTAPTLNDTGGGVQHARVVAIRGCISTTTPIDGEIGYQPIFAETTSTIPGLSTGGPDRLVLDCIVGEGPDVDGTNVYGTWTNSSLTSPTELVDSSTSVGTGGSLGIQAGGVPSQATTLATTVTHGNFRVVGKKIAFVPAVAGPPPTSLRYAKNARGQVLINGVPRLPLLIYDSNLPQFSNQYPEFLATQREMGRFTNKLDLYLNIHAGTLGNSIRFCDALVLYNMYLLATGNCVTVFELPFPGPTSFDIHDNATYNFAPLGSAPFRTHFANHTQSFGTYLYDEPSHGPSFTGNGVRTVFTAQGRPTVFTPPDFVVKVNGVQQTLNVDFTVATHAGFFDGVQGPNYTLTFAVPPASGRTFNIPVRFRYVFESAVTYQAQLKSQLPNHFTFGTLLNGDLGQYLEWSDDAIGDTIGSDIYVIGQGPESGTGATYGFMNFNVLEVAAMARYYALLNNKVPNIVLQLLHFGATSRFITASEIRSHCIAALTEFKGRGVLGWWAFGTQQGAIHQTNFNSGTSDGVNRVYGYNSRVDDAADVWVDVNGVRLNANQFVVNGIAQDTGYTVTLNVAPPAGQSVVVTNRSVGLVTREIWLSTLETLTTMIKQLEPIMLTPDDPSLITNNSGWFATPIAWRINLLQVLSSGAADRPTWLTGLLLLYQDELALLQQASPDTSLSNYLLDQRGHVRTASWEVGTTGLVTGCNMHPDPQTVTLTWHSSNITRVEVLGEGRDVPVVGGNSWTDTFGGGSAKRQGPFDQGHVYRLTLSGVTPPTAYTMLALPGSYDVTGATAVLTQIAGPTLVGFVWRR
jgi:hypothetical protein